jgi:hypothetical protein
LPPAAEGTFSQYWFSALMVESLQGAPAWFDATARPAGISSRPVAISRQNRSGLSLRDTERVAW